MALFRGMKFTNAGLNLLAKALIGKELKFTCAWAGDGYLPEGREIAEMTELISPKRKMLIQNMTIPPHIGIANITVAMTNKDLTDGFFIREIGLFAADPDTNNEVLYGYCNAGDTADFMPGSEGSSADLFHYICSLTAVVSQAKNVTAIFADNPLHVTYIEMNDRIDTVLKYIKEHDDALQEQINTLANTVIKNAIEDYEGVKKE